MFELYVYQNRARVGLVQNEISVQWMECYQQPGELKLVAGVTDENRALLTVGSRLYNTAGRCAMRIEQVELSDRGGVAEMTVRARCGAAMLDDRVVMATVNVQKAETGMYKLIRDNRRGLPVALAAEKGYTEAADAQQCWESVLAGEEALAQSSGLGFGVWFDPATATETFEVYKGADRTAGAGYNGFFGDVAGNIAQLQMVNGTADYKNVAVVAGCEEDAGREVVWVSPIGAIGEARRELFVDAKAIRRSYQLAHDTGRVDAQNNPVYAYTTASYTAAQYRQALQAFGLEALAKQLVRQDVKAEVVDNAMGYGRDYGLGDIVPVRLEAYRMMFAARVAAVTFVKEATGGKTVVTLRDFRMESD